MQKRRKTNKRKGGQNSAKVNYLLSGKIYCGKCGSSMQGHGTIDSKSKTRYYYYVCNNRKRSNSCDLKGVPKADIEGLVLDHLYNNIFSDGMIEKSVDKIFDYVNKKENNTPNMLDSYKKDLEKVEKDIEQTIDLLMTGYRHDSIKDRMDKLEEDKKDG